MTIHKYPGADHAFARHGGKTYSKPEADRALKSGATDDVVLPVLVARIAGEPARV